MGIWLLFTKYFYKRIKMVLSYIPNDIVLHTSYHLYTTQTHDDTRYSRTLNSNV